MASPLAPGPSLGVSLTFSLLSSPRLALGTWGADPDPVSWQHGAPASRAGSSPCLPQPQARGACLLPHNLCCLLSLPQAIVAVGFSVSMTTIRGWLRPKVAMATIRGESCLGCFGWLFHE